MPAEPYPPLAKEACPEWEELMGAARDMFQRRSIEAILEGLPSSLIARILACKGTITRTRELRHYDMLDGPTAIKVVKFIGVIEQCCASRKIAEVLMHYDGSEDATRAAINAPPKPDPEDHRVLDETRWE